MFRIHLLAPAVALSGLALALLFSAVSAGDKDAATTDAAAKPAVPAAAQLPEMAIGTAAPALNLPGADGKTHTWDDYKDAKATVVVFTCLSCPVAKAYEERLIALGRDYASTRSDSAIGRRARGVFSRSTSDS